MTGDFIDQTFADMDKYYPGSKRKRREPAPPKEVVEVEWSARPVKKTLPNGKDVEMYTIGALAAALGRPIITIRLWMKEGHLPLPPYRMATKVDKLGNERKGRRLYTRPMIEEAVSAFDRAGVLYATRIDWAAHTNLTKEIALAWETIRVNETATDKTDTTDTKDTTNGSIKNN